MPSDLEARVLHKITLRIVPFVVLLYFVSFLDRVNVGFAALSMNKALGLTPAMFGLGGGIFFVGYFLCEVPSNLILHRVGARLWIARVVVSWGIVSAASAFVIGPNSFYAFRFLLGIAEAGFFPGVILYLSLWFPARHRAATAALFMAAAPLSTAIGSPISGALMQLPAFARLANWQWLYLIEGLPAIVLGFAVLRILTDRPAQAKWLKPEERDWLVSTLESERVQRHSSFGHTDEVWLALSNPRMLALSLIYFGTSAGLYTTGLWVPLILQRFGFSPSKTGWVNALAGTMAVASMIAWARHSDRTAERTWHVVLPCLLGCLGFLWAGVAQGTISVILTIVIMNVGVSAAKAPLWAMPTMFLSGAGAAAGIAMINSLGNLGGFVGPFVIGWLKDRTGTFSAGLYMVGAMLGISAVVTVLLSRRSNGSRSQEQIPAASRL